MITSNTGSEGAETTVMCPEAHLRNCCCAHPRAEATFAKSIVIDCAENFLSQFLTATENRLQADSLSGSETVGRDDEKITVRTG